MTTPITKIAATKTIRKVFVSSAIQRPLFRTTTGQKRTFVVRLVIFIPSDADCDDRRDDWIFERKK